MFRHIGWFTAIVLYALIWWTLLFAILPLGTRTRQEADDVSGWRGTPENPQILKKALLTTLISIVVWGIFMVVINSDYLSFRNGWLALPKD
ncbi:putative membrane associated protein [Granulibacter bethesdensis]|uniref:Membrane associated protein n=1 Tax=Granulibacter bethesdensis TaxID=364410 RepID=A0AAC9KED9_9PROT|nr:DUF1467 family protein [Granulibacter bethesdensis]APH54585.1 putative membrane associated protein [Granulibacter bethesdensis]APH62171.1 putative membrane associated protein [Granulibacter bethesdensis]